MSSEHSKGSRHSCQYSDSDVRKAEVTNEIISSEKAYLTHLNRLIKLFVDPLSKDESIVKLAQSKMLFGELRSIRLVNQVLCDHLCENTVAEAFATLTPFLKLYSSYARNFPASQHLLQNLMNESGFRAFVKRQEDSVQCGGLKLPALLIMPIQRIPRYKLLLTELLKVSAEQEQGIISAIIDQVSDVAELVNACVDDQENIVRILAVQRQLDSCAPKLLVPGRKLIKEGKLCKLSRSGIRRVQDRQFWLFTDCILYAKATTAKKETYECSCVLPLRHCRAERIPGQDYFTLGCKGELLVLAGDSFSETNDWYSSIEMAIQSVQEQRLTLRKESSLSLPMRRQVLARLKKRPSTFTKRWASLRRQKQQEGDVEKEKDEPKSFFTRFVGGICFGSRKRKADTSLERNISTDNESSAPKVVHRYESSRAKRSRYDFDRSVSFNASSLRPLTTVIEEDSDASTSDMTQNRVVSLNASGSVGSDSWAFSGSATKSPARSAPATGRTRSSSWQRGGSPWWAEYDDAPKKAAESSLTNRVVNMCSVM